MGQGVVDQIGEQLTQQHGVADHPQTGLDLHLQVAPAVLGRRAEGFRHPLQHGRKVHLHQEMASGPALQLGDAQQGIEDRQHLIDVDDRRGHGGAAVLFACGVELGALQPLAHVAERRTQVVGDVGRHLAQAVHRSLQPVEHAVQAGREAVELGPEADRRQPLVEPAAHDPFGSEIDLLQPADEQPSGHQPADDGHEGEADAPPQGDLAQGLVELVQRIGAAAHHQHAAVGRAVRQSADGHGLVVALARIGRGRQQHLAEAGPGERRGGQIAAIDPPVRAGDQIEQRAAHGGLGLQAELPGQRRFVLPDALGLDQRHFRTKRIVGRLTRVAADRPLQHEQQSEHAGDEHHRERHGQTEGRGAEDPRRQHRRCSQRRARSGSVHARSRGRSWPAAG